MKNKWLHIILLIKVVLLVCGQEARGQQGSNNLFFADHDQKKMTLPFRFINNLSIIPLFINNSDTLFFVLDTGLTTAILTELSLSDSLSLEYSRRVRLSGLGEGEPIQALHSTGNRFRIHDIVGYNQDMYVLLQNIFNLSSLLGTRVHGIVGYDLFNNFIIEMDYPHRLITLHNPVFYEPKYTRNSITFPLEMQGTKPFITAEIEQEDGSRITVKLLVDLGASHALWLDPHTDDRIRLPEKTVETYLGTGLSGQIHGVLGKISKLILGPYILNEPIVAYPDSLSTALATRLGDRNGSIGSEILKRFYVIIDYPNKKLTLSPNRSFRDPFRQNMSGIEIESTIPGLPYYQITYIRKNSPADRAGLRRGDEIISINDQSALTMSINKIYDIFESKPGRKIKMTVRRRGEKYKTIFYLEDWL